MSGIITFLPNGAALRHLVSTVALTGALLFGGVLVAPTASAQQSDMDGDGLFDDEESLQYGTNPFTADTDGDLIDDRQEVALGTDPRDAASPGPGSDIDGDGLSDGSEVQLFGSSPTNPDTDGDGMGDACDNEPTVPYRGAEPLGCTSIG